MKNWTGLTHEHMRQLMIPLPSDFEPYGERNRDDQFGPDCSCGCKWFAAIEGKLSTDWGVCANPSSPRRGLLTFEHQGCMKFEENPEADEQIEKLLASFPKRTTWEEWVRMAKDRGVVLPLSVDPGGSNESS